MNLKFPDDFLFGVSNAAGQVEDQIRDNWIRFGERGLIPCYSDISQASERLKFWSDPDTELDLAQDLGCQVFRLSLNWERLVPRTNSWDDKAAHHYLSIFKKIKDRNMKVMLTLFHHSVPIWFEDDHGWTQKKSIEHFKFFSDQCFKFFHEYVDFWITLNEPVPWSYLTYTEGLFPPAKKGTILSHFKALNNMATAHNDFFDRYHTQAKIGIAHHMGHHKGRGVFNHFFAKLTDYLAHWSFLKKLKSKMNFFGINYYGAEWMTLKGPAQYDELEFSEAGRAVDPNGLYVLLKRIHQKYKGLDIIISENGVADETDLIRLPYLYEHLAVISNLIQEGVPIKAYIHWTLSDNLEWTDGYGPKFGLVEVLRDQNFKRKPRKSFWVYKDIIQNRVIEKNKRDLAWENYQTLKERPYWRNTDGKSGRETPMMRARGKNDWRFQKNLID
jgi:galactolipid galactosyltransferase